MKQKILSTFTKKSKIPKDHVLTQITFGNKVTSWTFVKRTKNSKEDKKSHVTIRFEE